MKKVLLLLIVFGLAATAQASFIVTNTQGESLTVSIVPEAQTTRAGVICDRFIVRFTTALTDKPNVVWALDLAFHAYGTGSKMWQRWAWADIIPEGEEEGNYLYDRGEELSTPDAARFVSTLDTRFLYPIPVLSTTATEDNDLSVTPPGGTPAFIEGWGTYLKGVIGFTDNYDGDPPPQHPAATIDVARLIVPAGKHVLLNGSAADGSGGVWSFGPLCSTTAGWDLQTDTYIPEPATLALIALGGLGLLRRRR